MHNSCSRYAGSLFAVFLGTGLCGQGQTGPVSVVDGEETITVTLDGRSNPVLIYNKVATKEASKHEPHFARSGYIHPLYSPAGKVVTGDFPADHKHQHALFFAWTKTKFQKRKPEFWNQKLEAGRISFMGVVEGSIVSSEGMGSFAVEHLWEDLTAPDGPVPVIKEKWKVTVYDVGKDRHLFDIESIQEMLGDKSLTIEKYHYGGMAIRGPDTWYSDEKEATPPGSIVTNEGLDRIEGNHSRPKWVAMSGPVEEGGEAGVAVIPAESNFRHPQWVRLHPNKPYFVYAPMVEESFTIIPGEPYISKFRYVVFDGEPDEEIINGEAQRMAED